MRKDADPLVLPALLRAFLERATTQGDAQEGDMAVLWADGASLGNPGPAGIGAVLETIDGRTLAEIAEAIGRATNNVAEYRALLRGLQEAIALGVRAVDVRLDSELVVRQVNGVYKVKQPALRLLHQEVGKALASFDAWSVRHVRREENARADALSRAAIRAGS